MDNFDKTKFNIAEIFNNKNGKSSGSGFLGIILGLIAGISFIIAMIGYIFHLPDTLNVMSNILTLAFTACALLGIRKIFSNK